MYPPSNALIKYFCDVREGFCLMLTFSFLNHVTRSRFALIKSQHNYISTKRDMRSKIDVSAAVESTKRTKDKLVASI